MLKHLTETTEEGRVYLDHSLRMLDVAAAAGSHGVGGPYVPVLLSLVNKGTSLGL